MSDKTNKVYAHDNEFFKEACAEAGIPPTPRQASKWRRNMGLAYKKHEEKQRQTRLENNKIS